MQELISIIIPVYNRKEIFKKALISVLKQTYKNIEVIVVDDGSKKELQNEDCKLQNGREVILFSQNNKGASVARNKGFELSGGEYVIFWDADIIGNPCMIEKMYKSLQNNPNASYVYCNHYLGNKKIKSHEFDELLLQKNNYISTMCLIRRTDFIGFDENLKRFQDWDLWLSMLEQNKKGVWLDEFLFKAYPCGTMSKWLPSFAYKKPWCYLPWISSLVRKYNEAKKIIVEKHSLNS